MELTSLTLTSLDIPFKLSFRHSSATRNKTDSAWVAASSENATGYGESCPRSYVTGEDMVTVVSFFEQHHDELLHTIHDLVSLRQWVASHEAEINQNPAAWCAIELAMLDLLGKENHCTVEQLLGLPALQGEFTYTGVLGDSDIQTYTQQVKQYASLGLMDFKIKVSDDVSINLEKINIIQGIMPVSRVRLDANNLWLDSNSAIEHLSHLSTAIFAVEEPLSKGDFDGLAEIAETLKVKIILDESFTNRQHFQPLLSHPQYWIINLRVSKVGGLLRAIEYATIAKEKGIACIVGAQVGETSLLTRAGLTAAQACKDNLVAQEGAFGLYLLEKDVCDKPLMFGKQGKIIASEIDGLEKPGFGVSVNI